MVFHALTCARSRRSCKNRGRTLLLLLLHNFIEMFGKNCEKIWHCYLLTFDSQRLSAPFHAPNFEEVGGHIGLGTSVCPSVRLSVTHFVGCKTKELLELGN